MINKVTKFITYETREWIKMIKILLQIAIIYNKKNQESMSQVNQKREHNPEN